MKILYFDEIASTSEYAKTLIKNKEDCIVTAKRQTGGKGTKGRSFSSNEGGVYLTKLTFYQDFPAKNACLIMAGAAVAVCKTLEEYGLFPTIKWANDVFVQERKICGILVENIFAGSFVSSSLVGIGLNVKNELPEELLEIAISMQKATGKDFSVDEVLKTLVSYLQQPFTMDDYRKRVGYLNRPVLLLEGDKKTRVKAVGVNEKLELEIEEENGARRLVRAAEVSLRLEE